MKKLFFIVLTLIMALFVFSYGFMNSEEIIGDIVSPISAYSGGMGNVCFIADPIMNPSLQLYGGQYNIRIGFGGMNYRESRSQYIFDSYDNNIGEKTLYDNSYYYGEPYFIGAYIPLSNFGVYIGYANLYSRDYNYDKIFRDAYYVTLYTDNYSIEGNINSYFISASFNVMGFTLGGNFSILQGDASTKSNVVYVDPSETDSMLSINEQYSGLKGGFALSYNYIDRVSATIFYHLPTIVISERSIDIIASDTISTADRQDGFIPSIFGLGIKYTPINLRPVTLLAEAIYERWSELNGEYMEYNDVIKYHIGIEHKMTKDFTTLYGILYEPYRKNNHVVDAGFTAGAVYEINNIDFALSAQYIQNEYEDNSIIYKNRYIKMNFDVSMTF
ncbi:hypothetical protein KAU15_05930 [candidate division WOR-3 bacterium]|nr:hypothetical protein [candidate division WOR-3 bacterium]